MKPMMSWPPYEGPFFAQALPPPTPALFLLQNNYLGLEAFKRFTQAGPPNLFGHPSKPTVPSLNLDETRLPPIRSAIHIPVHHDDTFQPALANFRWVSGSHKPTIAINEQHPQDLAEILSYSNVSSEEEDPAPTSSPNDGPLSPPNTPAGPLGSKDGTPARELASDPQEKHRFRCRFCSYSGSRRGHLVLHERTHTGERPFQCRYCPYTSAQKGYLVIHERTHTGERPFKCQFCPYTCARKGNLARHERTHTGERPFQCAECTYTASSRSDVVRHERIHNGDRPFRCQFCTAYSTTQKADLTKHERTHTGERPFRCTYCDYTSNRQSVLIIHERIHTGEKPFQCRHCSYSASSRSHVVRHQKIHTEDRDEPPEPRSPTEKI